MLSQMAGFPSLRPNNTPECVCVCVCVNECVCVNTHIFFIHSSVSGHSGCFHVLAVVNIAAVKIGVRYLFNILFSFPLDNLILLFYLIRNSHNSASRTKMKHT